MFSGKLRIASPVAAAGAIAMLLGACAVYEPAPAYPAYPVYSYYAPEYYYAPAPTTSLSFGYFSGPYRHRPYHHHRHWRG
jgi:hypothetical protein